MKHISRRTFLHQASSLSAAVALSSFVAPTSVARAAGPDDIVTLVDGWEFLRMPLAGPWEVWLDPPLAAWTVASLPHCFNSYDGCDPDTPAYRGKGWYRRKLDIANPYPGGRTLLHFEGAGQSSAVYLDGKPAGQHIGGYDEFVFDVTDVVHGSKAAGTTHELSILCDNSPDLERMPSDLSDFTLYGGLYRNVHLVYVPAVSLERVRVDVDAAADRDAQVKVRARIYRPAAKVSDEVEVDISVTSPTGTEVYRSRRRQPAWDGALELASFAVPHAQLWSPSAPALYECRVTVTAGSDRSEHTERFGIRFYQFVEHGPFLLNGQRLLIQGTHRHEDHASYAAAMPADLIRQEMHLIKDMGANFIRLAHYQQQRLVLELCDELGLLVWEEIPWCRAGVGDEAFRRQGREKLATMIDQHGNHPSVILWGLGNEDDWDAEYPSVDKQAIRDYMQELHTLARTLDPSRLTSFRRCDFARDIPDVYSPSIWAGWYGGRYVDYQHTLTVQFEKSPRMLHVEWGADAHARRHAEDPYKLLSNVKESDTAERGLAYLQRGGPARVSSEGDWSETYACDLYDWHLKVQQSLPWLTGAVQWAFKDFTTPLRVDNPIPRVNQKGLIERDMTKKEGYFVFQSYWATQPMVHIYGHSWPIRWGKPNEARTVRVYSNCPTAELFVNDVSAGVRTRNIQDFPAAGLHWQIPFRSGPNRLHVVAHAADGTTVSDAVSFRYETRAWGAPVKLALRRLRQAGKQVTVEGTLLDAQGSICLDARNVVRFSVAGNGSIADNQGTSTGSRVVQLYNGRVQATIIKSDSGCIVGLSADGVAAASCAL